MAVSEPVHFNLREHVSEPNTNFEFVDFIESGALSFLTVMEEGSLVELATIGRDGMLGVCVALGTPAIAQLVYCQVEASGLRVPIKAFQRLLIEHKELADVCSRFGMALFENVSINIGCNRVHSIAQRCARWMLLSDDRCESNSFVLTQEFLAAMLGISRTSVNFAAGQLLKAGIISYTRGKISVLDRRALEEVSCPCYESMNVCYQRIMGFPAVQTPDKAVDLAV